MSIIRDVSVVDALEEIRSGRFATEIASLRAEIVLHGKDSDKVRDAKLRLPAYLFSGRVAGRVARAMPEGRFHHSGLLQLDFDGLEDPAAVRDMLIQDPHVLAAWISPSGEGTKGLLAMDPAATEAEHLAAFLTAEAYWKARGLTLDKTCKNSNRLCFAGHDPDLRWNDEAVPLRVLKDQNEPLISTVAKKPALVIKSGFPEPPHEGIHTWLMEAAWHCRFNDMTEHDAVEKLQSYDGSLRRPLQPREAVDAARSVFLSPLQGDTRGKAPTAEQEARKANLRALAYALRFDPNKTPPPDETCMAIGDIPIASRGNLTVIQGKSKVGKSAVVAAVMGAAQRGNQYSAADTLQITWEGENAGTIIHLDTEQSLSDWHALVCRGVTRSGLPSVSERLVSLPLVMFPRGDRLEILRQSLEYELGERGTIDAVIIDGIADLCSSPNDEAEALGLVSEIMALSQKFATPIFCILHENPGTEQAKTRGHLGSELNRKAFANLRIDKDTETSVSTLYGTDMRKREIPKEQGFCFAWDEQSQMHIFQGRAAGLKAAQREALAVAKERETWGPIFEFVASQRENTTVPALSTKDACEAELELSGTDKLTKTDTMKKRMQKAETLGVLRKIDTLRWSYVPAGTAGT